MIVKSEIENLGLHCAKVDLGEAETLEDLSYGQCEKLKFALLKSGLELMNDRRSILTEKIKNAVIELVHYTDELPRINFSEYLSKKLNYDYNYLSNLFTEVQGTTIEKFIIFHKIERVKELIVYDELSLSEIALKLRYSSVAHLSNQFKKITGLSPTHFKKLKEKKRSALESIK